MNHEDGPALNYYQNGSSGLGAHYDVNNYDLRKLSNKKINLEDLPYITCICYLNTIPEEGGGGTSFFESKDDTMDMSAMQESSFRGLDPCKHGQLISRAKPIAGDLCDFRNYIVSENGTMARINPHSGDPPNERHSKYILHFLLRHPATHRQKMS